MLGNKSDCKYHSFYLSIHLSISFVLNVKLPGGLVFVFF